MTRVPEPSREQLDPSTRAIYDRIAATRGGLRGPYGVLLNHPALCEHVAALGEQLRFHSVLSGADRELAILAAGREAESPYEWAAHEPIALREGTRPEAIAIVRDGAPTRGLRPREALIVDTVRAIYRAHRLSSDEFTRAEAELGRQRLIELVTLAGYYGMIAGILNAFEVDLPPGAAAPAFARRDAGGPGPKRE
ncbi:MAG TPA: carboxymuconolactone decarboxylase family protein [Methylomirabilota bacterium]|jgi:4-carboxymuconolactone decarboxylase